MTEGTRNTQDRPALPVRTMVTEYVVTALPEDSINVGHFSLTVEYRGEGRWAVKRWSSCLSRSGEWHHESVPSEREDEWLADHRFDLDTALRLAQENAPLIRVNGHSVADVLRMEAADRG